MIYIPAGDFLMGDGEKEPSEPDPDPDPRGPTEPYVNDNPRHTVRLSGYWIYKNMVTVGMYKRFCLETGRPMPPTPDEYAPTFNPNWSREDHPIVNVSWMEAMAYGEWASQAGVTLSLPTEAQWEKAARGTDGRQYPWGDVYDPSKVWESESRCMADSPFRWEDIGRTRDNLEKFEAWKKARWAEVVGTTAVGRYGISPYGVTDMAGNAFQWCRDWYDKLFWNSPAAEVVDPENQSLGERKNRVARGGAWCCAPSGFRASCRWSGFAPDTRSNMIGFRCASTLPYQPAHAGEKSL